VILVRARRSLGGLLLRLLTWKAHARVVPRGSSTRIPSSAFPWLPPVVFCMLIRRTPEKSARYLGLMVFAKEMCIARTDWMV
jgi:hypothetical protein